MYCGMLENVVAVTSCTHVDVEIKYSWYCTDIISEIALDIRHLSGICPAEDSHKMSGDKVYCICPAAIPMKV